MRDNFLTLLLSALGTSVLVGIGMGMIFVAGGIDGLTFLGRFAAVMPGGLLIAFTYAAFWKAFYAR